MSEECDTSTENGHNFCMIPFTGAYNPNIILPGIGDVGEKIKIPRGMPGCLGILNENTKVEDPKCYINEPEPDYPGKFIKVPKGMPGCSGTIDSITGQDKPSCYILKNDPYGKITRIRGENELLIPGKNTARLTINYGPYIPLVGYVKSETQNMEFKNQSINLPMDEDSINPNDGSIVRNLITGIEIVPTSKNISGDIFVARLSGVYYSDITKISKSSAWKGYNEGSGKIDLVDYNLKEIQGIGWSEITEEKILLNGSFQDSALCGIWYKYVSNNSLSYINNRISGICVAYRRLFDRNVNTEYIYFERGTITKSATPPNASWIGNECASKGEFISQITFYYNDFNTAQLNRKPEMFGIKLSLGGLGVNIESYHDNGFGLKGIGKYRSLNYDVKDGLYKWVSEIDKLRCCQLLSDQQYNDDTVEKYVCRDNFNLKVNNNFPDSFPNDQCKTLLGNWCGTSYIDEYKQEVYNIEDDLCKKACNISDVDCDRGIKNYCLRPKMLAGGTGSKYDLGKFNKDEICGCMTSQNFKNNDPLTSVPLSFKTLLNTKLLNKAGVNLDKQECILPYCSQSPFKLLTMKQNLEKVPCNKKELCFGNGYAIPDYSDNNTKVQCVSYENAEDECIEPLTPKITIIPDPFTNGCKNLITNELVMPKYKPADCVYGEKWYPEDPYSAKCEMHVDPEDGEEKLMLRSYRQLEKPSVPEYPPGEDNPACPPKCGEGNPNCDYPLKTPDEREPVEKWESCYNDGTYVDDETPPSSGLGKIGMSLLIFAIIIGLIFAIFIKIIKK
jgi:hypothetical protein